MSSCLSLLLDSHRSIQGNEMAHHERFTVETGVQVYFCDPQSPWQLSSI
jgi:IS30 family transposase